jgi:hypothetical protein
MIFLNLSSLSAWAYPEFIGYGYSSCLTCHYNGQGNGPINDYGRAVWAGEIAARTFAGNKTDEELAASSGIIGAPTNLPWWLRPGVKTRDMLLYSGPGTSSASTRNIIMQADVNVALLFDKKSDLIFVGSYGYVPEPFRLQSSDSEKVDNGISREHYLRWHQNKKLWLYFGMLDKVYGIRTVNHTAFSRSKTGLGQNDQSHSVIAHYIESNWEATFDVFAGNMFQHGDLRQKGVSMMFEYEPIQNWKVGASFLTSSNDYVRYERFGIHSKRGLNDGASLLFEAGLIRDTPKTQDIKQGYYVYSQAMQKLFRGMHLFFSGQLYKDDVKNSKTDNIKLSGGLLFFPMSRFEIRMEAENTRRFSTDSVNPDSWTMLTQIHMSL